MVDFGAELRALRERRGLRQSDLVAMLRPVFARSTIANVEAGREAPSERLWSALAHAFPDDAVTLERAYLESRRHRSRDRRDPLIEGPRDHQAEHGESPLGGALVIERRDIAFVFRESTSPEEVIETFDIRSRQDGLASYVTKMRATNQEGFRLAPELLWGGRLVESEHVDRDGYTFVLREIEFGHALSKGERHCFAMRSWVENDQDPDNSIDVTPVHPTGLLAIHLTFAVRRPAAVWMYGPVPDEAMYPRSPDDPGARAPDDHGEGRYSAVFERPELGETYGIDWRWD